MTSNRNGGLNHHEELRYFYLLRNLTILTENEQMEYRYLKSKLESANSEQYRTNNYSQQKNPQSSQYQGYNESRSGREELVDLGHDYTFDQEYYQPPQSYPSQNISSNVPDSLPLYPSDQNLSRRAKKQSKSKSRSLDYSTNTDYQSEPVKSFQTEITSGIKNGRKKKSFKKIIKAMGLLFLIALLGIGIMFLKGIFDVSNNSKDYKPAVTETFHGKNTVDGTNILVLGSDQRVTEESTEARTDTIMVVNVGNKDNKVKMVSFMRDTLVNIPGYSYDDYSYDLKLNSSFNLGEQDEHQGADLVRKVLKHNYDIDIKYYVMVDFETFAQAIDTLFPNGVKIDAKFATIDGKAVSSVKVPDDLRMKNGIVPDQTIKVGEQRMDGRTLLNYARFRKDDEGDFGRTVRQQQVMSAIMSQVKDPTKLFTGSAAVGKIYALTSTNVSFPFVAKHGLSTVASGKGIEHVTIPENGDWIDEYDMYGGQALQVDFAKYQARLKKMGLR